MSQVFSADSVNAGSGGLPVGSYVQVVLGNVVNPPFGNAKAIVSGYVNLTVGTGGTAIAVNIIRNPTKENVSVLGGALSVTVTAGSVVGLAVQGADVIPDGRGVQYALQVNQPNGSVAGGYSFANITTMLISG